MIVWGYVSFFFLHKPFKSYYFNDNETVYQTWNIIFFYILFPHPIYLLSTKKLRFVIKMQLNMNIAIGVIIFPCCSLRLQTKTSKWGINNQGYLGKAFIED